MLYLANDRKTYCLAVEMNTLSKSYEKWTYSSLIAKRALMTGLKQNTISGLVEFPPDLSKYCFLKQRKIMLNIFYNIIDCQLFRKILCTKRTVILKWVHLVVSAIYGSDVFHNGHSTCFVKLVLKTKVVFSKYLILIKSAAK